MTEPEIVTSPATDVERLGWMKMGAQTYLHYCGARISKIGRHWIARTVDGNLFGNHSTVTEAVSFLEKQDPDFWSYGEEGTFAKVYGVWFNTGSEISGNLLFIAYADSELAFSQSLRKAFGLRFFGKAHCAKCHSPMLCLNLRQLLVVRELECEASKTNFYVVCDCGYPVWRTGEFVKSLQALRRSELERRRRELLSSLLRLGPLRSLQLAHLDSDSLPHSAGEY